MKKPYIKVTSDISETGEIAVFINNICHVRPCRDTQNRLHAIIKFIDDHEIYTVDTYEEILEKIDKCFASPEIL